MQRAEENENAKAGIAAASGESGSARAEARSSHSGEWKTCVGNGAFSSLTAPARARELLAQSLHVLGETEVPLDDALGLRLARAPIARFDIPPADVSMMDGYAARAEDLGDTPLPIGQRIAAGDAPVTLPPGTVARIQTGALVPLGADVVVPQERAVVIGETVKLEALSAGGFIRRKGEILPSRATIGRSGETVTPHLLAFLCAAGVTTLRVVPRPRLAIITTGSELVRADEDPTPGKIRDGNGLMLVALARQAGLNPTVFGQVADTVDALRSVLHGAARNADLIVSTGGVSVGDYDLVRRVIEDLGGKIIFHGLSIKPGKPTLAARIGPCVLLGLPGNPLSALVGWRLVALAVARHLAGDPMALHEKPEYGILANEARSDRHRTTFAPARIQEDKPWPRIEIPDWKGSHDLRAAASANALTELPNDSALRAGDKVGFYRL